MRRLVVVVAIAMLFGCKSQPAELGQPALAKGPSLGSAVPAPPVASGPPPASANPPLAADAAKLVGVWQAAPDVGSGYDDLYLFFADGRYDWHRAQGSCSNGKLEASGHWKVVDRTLQLTEEKTLTHRGGKVVQDDLGCELRGGSSDREVLASPVVRVLDRAPCKDPQDSPYDCERFGDSDFWQIRDDPTTFEP